MQVFTCDKKDEFTIHGSSLLDQPEGVYQSKEQFDKGAASYLILVRGVSSKCMFGWQRQSNGTCSIWPAFNDNDKPHPDYVYRRVSDARVCIEIKLS